MDYNTNDCFYCGLALGSGGRVGINADVIHKWIEEGEKNSSEILRDIMVKYFKSNVFFFIILLLVFIFVYLATNRYMYKFNSKCTCNSKFIPW